VSHVEIRIPEEVFNRGSAKKFEKFVGDRVGKERAREILRAVLTDRVQQIAQRYVAAMRRQVIEILAIRHELARSYNEVIAHLSAGGRPESLPQRLRPEAFDEIFNRLQGAFDGLVDPQSFLEELGRSEPTPRATRQSRQAEDLSDSLRLLQRRYGATIEALPEGPRVQERVDGVHRLIADSRFEEATAALANLNHDLDLARNYLLESGTADRGAIEAEAAERGLSPDERTRLANREGLRIAPDDLIAEGSPELPLDQIEINRRPFLSLEDRAELAEILALARRGRKEAIDAGYRYERLVKRVMPKEELVDRHGRLPDLGQREITISGRDAGFGSQKIRQFWVDITDLGEIDLIVPELSPEALTHLRRIGRRAELRLGITVEIRVTVTAP
jgi:hypothetical protein